MSPAFVAFERSLDVERVNGYSSCLLAYAAPECQARRLRGEERLNCCDASKPEICKKHKNQKNRLIYWENYGTPSDPDQSVRRARVGEEAIRYQLYWLWVWCWFCSPLPRSLGLVRARLES